MQISQDLAFQEFANIHEIMLPSPFCGWNLLICCGFCKQILGLHFFKKNYLVNLFKYELLLYENHLITYDELNLYHKSKRKLVESMKEMLISQSIVHCLH